MAREMKDSGIPWIGEIPADWSLIATKRLYKIESGATPKSENSDYYDGSIPWITPADFKTNDVFVFCGRRNITELGLNSCGTILIPAKSIIFSKRAPIGAVAINKVDLCTNQGCLSCIPKVDLEVKYFYYAMSIFTKQYNLLGTGTTFKEISTTDFANFVLPYPSLYQQQKIARYLDKSCARIDAVLNKTRTSIEEYKKLKQAIITQAVTKGVRGDRPMKESGIIWLDAVPEDWKISKIKYAIFPHEKPVLPTDDVITCFRDGTVTLRKNRREEGFTVSFTENGYQGVDVGDLVIHGMDTFAGAIGCSDSRGKTSPVVHVCSTVGNNRYFMYFLRYMAYSNLLMDFSNGVRIRSSDFRNFKKLAVFEMLVPSLEEQNEIVDYLDSTLAKIEQVINQKESLLNELESYKKTVIYEYVTGKKEAS